jgi:hypothetical protein
MERNGRQTCTSSEISNAKQKRRWTQSKDVA